MRDVQGLINLMPFDSYDELQERISKDILSDKRKSIYDLLKKKDYQDIDELIEDLDDGANRKAVVKNIQRLKNQLLDKLFFLDIGNRNTTVRHERILKVYKKYAALKILEQWEESEAFAELAKELILNAQKYELYDVVMLLAERLEFFYSVYLINDRLAKKYAQIYDESLLKLTMAREVSRYYNLFLKMVVGGKQVYSSDYLDSFAENMERLQQIQKELPTFNITQRVQTTLYYYYLLKRDFKELVEICDETISYYSSRENYSGLRLYMSEMRKGVAYIYMQKYDEARPLIQGLDRFNATPGTMHWNSGRSYQFILEMITANYQTATDILIDTVTDGSIKKIANLWSQQWNIRSAYIHFLAKIGLVNLETYGKKRVPNFRLGKFLNNVPQYSKDKRGLNLSIIIAQFLILLSEKKYDAIADRIEALNKYSYRHLKNDYRLRSNCFIRMLLQLPRANYHPIRANRYAKKYLDKLMTTQINFSEFSTEIEIIPFEDLWQIIINMLSKKNKT